MTTANGIQVDENTMKLIQGYMLALIAGNDQVATYFENRIEKLEIDNFVRVRPSMFDNVRK